MCLPQVFFLTPYHPEWGAALSRAVEYTTLEIFDVPPITERYPPLCEVRVSLMRREVAIMQESLALRGTTI